MKRGASRAAAATLIGLATMMTGCSASPDGSGVYARYAKTAALIGMFRDDPAAGDIPYDGETLIRNFEKVIFDQEDQKIAIGAATHDDVYTVAKWTTPIRYRLLGDGVRPEDRDTVRLLATQLESATGLSIEPARERKANLTISILSQPAREAWIDRMSPEQIERLKNTATDAWLRTLDVPCAGRVGALRGSEAREGAFSLARIYVKDELVGAPRSSCFHEEFAQALGLLNDHNDVRPSIFNDTNEFGVVTDHDRDLLKILYDDRLKPGMSRAEAMPIVREIVAELEMNG